MKRKDFTEEDFWDADDATYDGPFYHGWKAAVIAGLVIGAILVTLYGIKVALLG